MVIDFLSKVGHAEALLVKYFETDSGSLGKSGTGQFKADFIDLVRRNIDGRTTVLKAIGDLLLLEAGKNS